MEIKKDFKVDIYGCKVVIILTDTMNVTIKKYLAKLKIPFEDGYYEGLFVSGVSKDTYHIILNKQDLSVNTIAHESFHLASAILKDRGINTCGEDEEPMAYLVGFVVDRILKIATDLLNKNGER